MRPPEHAPESRQAEEVLFTHPRVNAMEIRRLLARGELAKAETVAHENFSRNLAHWEQEINVCLDLLEAGSQAPWALPQCRKVLLNPHGEQLSNWWMSAAGKLSSPPARPAMETLLREGHQVLANRWIVGFAHCLWVSRCGELDASIEYLLSMKDLPPHGRSFAREFLEIVSRPLWRHAIDPKRWPKIPPHLDEILKDPVFDQFVERAVNQPRELYYRRLKARDFVGAGALAGELFEHAPGHPFHQLLLAWAAARKNPQALKLVTVRLGIVSRYFAEGAWLLREVNDLATAGR